MTAPVRRVRPAAGGGVATLYAEGLEWLEAPGAGTATILVPGEYVHLLAVDLPLAQHRDRVAALPFAVEEHLAEPLTDVHVALGPELTARKYVSAVVRHSEMRAWLEAIERAEPGRRFRLVPDSLVLPVPEEGSWSVHSSGDRTIVRTADGLGFVLGSGLLPIAWKAAGEPLLISYGGPAALDAPGRPAEFTEETFIAHALSTTLDLRQGVYAEPSREMPAAIRRIALVIAAGAAAHIALGALDLGILRTTADQREAEARSLLRELVPDAPGTGEVAARLAALLPGATDRQQGQFLPLFARIADALAPFAASISVQGLTFDAAGGALDLDLEAPDLGALQRIESALSEAGMRPVSGPATTGRGGAEARISVRSGV